MATVNKPMLDPVKREEIILSLRQCEHKAGVNSMDWHKVNEKLLILAAYTLVYCKSKGLPIIFTSIIRPQIKGVSKSKTHEQGRAFDLSVRGWSKADILEFVDKINKEYKLGAVSAATGEEKEAVYEDGITAGKGAHLHVQCRP